MGIFRREGRGEEEEREEREERRRRAHPPLSDATELAMGRVIRGCRKGKGSVFTSHTHTRKGAAKHRQQVREREKRLSREMRGVGPSEAAAGSPARKDRCFRRGETMEAMERDGNARVIYDGDVGCARARRSGEVDAVDGDGIGWIWRPCPRDPKLTACSIFFSPLRRTLPNVTAMSRVWLRTSSTTRVVVLRSPRYELCSARARRRHLLVAHGSR